MNLKAEWLIVIEKIAEHGSMSEAARDLGYTQQALSYTLGLAEQYFNGPLFERNSRLLILTPEGERVLTLAQKYRQQVSDLQASLQRFQSNELPRQWKIIRSDNFSSSSQIARLVAGINAAFAQDTFQFDWATQHQLESMLLNENMALGLSIYPGKAKAIRSFRLFESPYVWVRQTECLPEHAMSVISFDYHYVNRARQILHVSDAYHYLAGLTLPDHHPKITASSMYEIIQLVKAGCGKACVPLIDVQDAIDTGQLCLLETTSETVSGYLLVAESLVPEDLIGWLEQQGY